MRINLHTTSNTTIVPFDYQQKMLGVVHKWLGNNDLHNRISLYSFSWLFKGVMVDKIGFTFPQGVSFFISFYEDEYLKILIRSIQQDPELFCGLTVRDITIVEPPSFNEGAHCFRLRSPIFIKRAQSGERGLLTLPYQAAYYQGDNLRNSLIINVLVTVFCSFCPPASHSCLIISTLQWQ